MHNASLNIIALDILLLWFSIMDSKLRDGLFSRVWIVVTVFSVSFELKILEKAVASFGSTLMLVSVKIWIFFLA